MVHELPDYIFFTGVPGSRWSGIAQVLETIPGMTTSDRTAARTYSHHSYTGHVGAYFGRGMELAPTLDAAHINSAWSTEGGTKLVKSHDWAYKLQEIKSVFPTAWIMLVYRPDMNSYAWWHEAGGFQIKYPCYNAYKNSPTMLAEIMAQNAAILEFGMINNSKWEYFTSAWLADNFSIHLDVTNIWPDILVTLIK
jgi:hypothetical protein